MITKKEVEEFIHQAILLQVGNRPSFRKESIQEIKVDQITKLDIHAIQFGAINVEKISKIYGRFELSKEMIQCNIARYHKLVSKIRNWDMKDIHELIFNMNLFWFFSNYKEHRGPSIILKCYDFDPVYSTQYVIPEEYLFTDDVANIKDINVNKLKSALFDKKASVNAQLFAMDKQGCFMVKAARSKDVLSLMYAENPPWHRWRFSQKDMFKPAAKFILTDHVRSRMQDPAKSNRLNWNVYFCSCEAISQGLNFRSKAYESYILEHVKPRGVPQEAIYQALNEGVFVEEGSNFGRYEFASEVGVLVVKVDTLRNTIPTVYYKGMSEDKAKILVEIENIRKELIDSEERDRRLNFCKETFKSTKFIVRGGEPVLALIKIRIYSLYHILEAGQNLDFDKEPSDNSLKFEKYIYRMGLLCEAARLLSVIYDNCDNINYTLIGGLRNTIYYKYAETFENLSESELIALFSVVYKLIIDGIPDIQGLSPLKHVIDEYTRTKPNFVTVVKDCLSNHTLKEPLEPIAAKLSLDKKKLSEMRQYCSVNQQCDFYEEPRVANILRGNCLGLLTIWLSGGVTTLLKKQNIRDHKSKLMQAPASKKTVLMEYEGYIKPGVEYRNNTLDYEYILCLYNIPSYKLAIEEISSSLSAQIISSAVQLASTGKMLCDSKSNPVLSQDKIHINDLTEIKNKVERSQALTFTSTQKSVTAPQRVSTAQVVVLTRKSNGGQQPVFSRQNSRISSVSSSISQTTNKTVKKEILTSYNKIRKNMNQKVVSLGSESTAQKFTK